MDVETLGLVADALLTSRGYDVAVVDEIKVPDIVAIVLSRDFGAEDFHAALEQLAVALVRNDAHHQIGLSVTDEDGSVAICAGFHRASIH